MNKILEGYASFYHPNDSTGSGKYVAMNTLKICPSCEGKGYNNKVAIHPISKEEKEFRVPCGRCGGDGRLINRVKWDAYFPGCALPESIATQLGAVFMDKILITSYNPVFTVDYKIGGIMFPEVYAFYIDIQKDNNCRCGHDKGCHIFEPLESSKPIVCSECKCIKYEPRIIDLFPCVFSKLAPLDRGLIKIKIEVAG